MTDQKTEHQTVYNTTQNTLFFLCATLHILYLSFLFCANIRISIIIIFVALIIINICFNQADSIVNWYTNFRYVCVYVYSLVRLFIYSSSFCAPRHCTAFHQYKCNVSVYRIHIITLFIRSATPSSPTPTNVSINQSVERALYLLMLLTDGCK